jgi:subtilisin family serine protease
MSQSPNNLDRENSTAYLLIPRSTSSTTGNNTTFSPVVNKRNSAFRLDDLAPSDLYQNLQNENKLNELKALGMSTVFFSNEEEQKSVKNEWQDKYYVIPDFPVSIPTPISSDNESITQNSCTNNDESQWPSISGISKAHKMGIKGQGVLVGVLDTGVDADHQEFSGRSINYRYVDPFGTSDQNDYDVRGFNPDIRGHGTEVCGVIAGNSIGIAPEVDLYVASVIESQTNKTSFLRVMRGLNWLMQQFQSEENRNKPAVLNMSICFPSFSTFTPSPDIPTKEALQSLIDDLQTQIVTLLTQANVLAVVSIGNGGTGKFNYPGAFQQVLGVGAIDFQGKLAAFSGSGKPSGEVSKPDIVGYGVDVCTSHNRDFMGTHYYKPTGGTSISSPYVAGIAALYRCQQPTLTVEEVRTKIIENAFKLDDQPSEGVGAGLVRFCLE